MPIITPKKQARWIARSAGTCLMDGETNPGEATASPHELIYGEGENAFLQAATTAAVNYNPLPTSGTIEAGKIYTHKGICVLCRQTHTRTIYDPADTPALFAVYRAGRDTLDWIEKEKVEAKCLRTYSGKTYICLQDHMTQSDWTPDKSPTLWAEYVEPTAGPQPWKQPAGAHDAYALGAKVTHKSRTWESLYAANVWEPGVFGWKDIGAAMTAKQLQGKDK